MSTPAVERIESVTFDFPSPSQHEPLGDVFVWKAAYGFECVASIANRLFHGVSPDGKWLVMERYPLDHPFDFPEMPQIGESVRATVSKYGEPSSAMPWGGHLYVYVRGKDGYRRVELTESSKT